MGLCTWHENCQNPLSFIMNAGVSELAIRSIGIQGTGTVMMRSLL
jgi:hypothetical protein